MALQCSVAVHVLCGFSMQGGKVIGRVVVIIIIVVSTEWLVSTMKKWLQYASNRGTRTTSVTDSTFLLANVAMPVDSACPTYMYMYCTRHGTTCILLMRTTKWPSIWTGKDCWNVLNNACDIPIGLYYLAASYPLTEIIKCEALWNQIRFIIVHISA